MPNAKYDIHSIPDVLNVNLSVPSSSSDSKSLNAKKANTSVDSRSSNPCNSSDKKVNLSVPACSSDPSTSKQEKQRVAKPTNVPIPSTGVISDIKASRSKSQDNTRNDRTSQATNVHWKRVEEQSRNLKFESNKTNRVF